MIRILPDEPLIYFYFLSKTNFSYIGLILIFMSVRFSASNGRAMLNKMLNFI